MADSEERQTVKEWPILGLPARKTRAGSRLRRSRRVCLGLLAGTFLTVDQIAKKPTVAAAITPVASQPVIRIGMGSVSRPMIRGLVAMSMMIAIKGCR